MKLRIRLRVIPQNHSHIMIQKSRPRGVKITDTRKENEGGSLKRTERNMILNAPSLLQRCKHYPFNYTLSIFIPSSRIFGASFLVNMQCVLYWWAKIKWNSDWNNFMWYKQWSKPLTNSIWKCNLTTQPIIFFMENSGWKPLLMI